MRSRLSALALAALVGIGVASAPAASAQPSIDFKYTPIVAADDPTFRVTWKWDVSNRSHDETAERIVLVHKIITPDWKVSGASDECTVVDDVTVQCEYSNVGPQQWRRGKLWTDPTVENPGGVQLEVTISQPDPAAAP
ncbi:hypothetical protein [Streptomyces cyaneofuscatus]|uniref:hypothetical protein n=1 Tax=Streptomyces cyaneofuscatus TaxID=66883 RepID=UPI0037FDFEA8